MKHIWVFIVTFLLGVYPMNASEDLSNTSWVTIKDDAEQLQASFPHQPVHMQFDVSKKEQLDVYVSPFKEGIVTLFILSGRPLKDSDLEPKAFENLFYSVFVQRMFNQPKIFKVNQQIDHEKTSFEGNPALKFSFSYQDRDKTRLLEGLTILKDEQLITLFYLASEDVFNEAILQRFIDSLQLN